VLASLATNQYSHFWLKGIPVNRHCMIVSDSYADSGGAIHSRFVSLLLCFSHKEDEVHKISAYLSITRMAFFFSEKLLGRHHFGEVWPTGMGAKHQRPTSCPYLLPKSRASSGQKNKGEHIETYRDNMRQQWQQKWQWWSCRERERGKRHRDWKKLELFAFVSSQMGLCHALDIMYPIFQWFLHGRSRCCERDWHI
jgi:hypothetical protein